MIVGAMYFAVGCGSAALDPSVPGHVSVAWRLGAWAASALAYAAHIRYERIELCDSPAVTARHAAVAVALGALLLAVAATIHAAMVEAHAPFWRYLLALVLWPAVTALPAFLVALALTAGLARLQRGTGRRTSSTSPSDSTSS